MKCIETQSAEATESGLQYGAHFTAVRDSRNRRIAGLYRRGDRYYGQIWMKVEKTARKFPLLNPDGAPVANLNEAKEAMEILRHHRRENALPTIGQKPAFAEYVETYFQKAEIAQKKPGSLENERQSLKRWKEYLGEIRVDRITTPMVDGFKDMRLRSGCSPRTVNLDQVALRNVLKRAVEDGHLREVALVSLRLKNLKTPPPPKRGLLTPAEFARLLAAAPVACEKNAVQVSVIFLR